MTEILARPVVTYLAGPMEGLPNYNHEAFAKAARDLRERGLIVLNPAESVNADTRLPRSWYMQKDISEICQLAEVLHVIPGWQSSPGAKLEVILADNLGLSVFQYTPDMEYPLAYENKLVIGEPSLSVTRAEPPEFGGEDMLTEGERAANL